MVKTVCFKDPKYVGDPINAVKIFNEKEADELAVFDIDVTVRAAEPNFRMISKLAAECRMPLCYGGGVKTVSQARQIIGLGVEKIALSSAAVETPELIAETAREIGGQSVVVVIDAKKDHQTGQYLAWTHNGCQKTGRSVVDLAQQAESLGAGEIVINSIDQDGKMKGYDLELARLVRQSVRLPISLLGGAGSLSDIGSLLATCGTVGAAAGSLFVFKGPYKAVLINYPESSTKEQLFAQKTNSKS
ncbi:AglZ/HisF2 family acetamidino modification protein [Bradyrhizobium guangdongense]